MSLPVQLGSVGGVPVIADVTPLGPITNVILTADYLPIDPPGFPARPPAGSATPWYPRLLLSGTAQQFLACEAAALVQGGFATYD